MYQKPTVPRSIGGVLDDTLQLYKAAFSSCLLTTVIVSLLIIGLGLYKLAQVPVAQTGSPVLQIFAQLAATSPGYQLASILVGLVQLLLTGMLVVIITAISKGEAADFGEAFRIASRRYPALLGASILAGLAAVVGFVLLVIPGIYVLNRLQLFMVPLVTESKGPGESLSTSWRLVGGHWWRTASLVFVMVVMVYILGLVLIAIVGAIAVAIVGAPANILQGFDKFGVLGVVSGAVVSLFTRPLMIAVLVAMYQDLLLRKGGGDLEARIGALSKG
jgi:hypothetical protein